MKNRHNTIYVIGAGFSAGLGYPLTRSLLVEVWPRLGAQLQERLGRVIQFHFPTFDPEVRETFPDIEHLLTRMAINEEMFEASRPREGGFTKAHLRDAKEGLLYSISTWFHDLYKGARTVPWLAAFVARVHDEGAAVISFNWDLILDHQLFPRDALGREIYGLGTDLPSGPVLLKPHGSLNWYGADQVKKVKPKKRTSLYRAEQPQDQVEAFLYPREIRSKSQGRYTPIIVPPTYVKDFRRPIFRRIWQRCTELLSTPQRIFFVGYSFPQADLQAEFIIRCGFYNQVHGMLGKSRGRTKATGAADVNVVNPSEDAAKRVKEVMNSHGRCEWHRQRVEDWVATTQFPKR